jgi:hypothetical protein
MTSQANAVADVPHDQAFPQASLAACVLVQCGYRAESSADKMEEKEVSRGQCTNGRSNA